ncbi:alpha/beta fold hydrolase [Microtetraspora malaysiensis]
MGAATGSRAVLATPHQVLDSLDGPVVLVGHSYGGVVISRTCSQ